MPASLEALILDGRVAYVALAVLVLEAVALLVTGRRAFLGNVLSGVFLILALRSGLLREGAGVVSLWLSLGFLSHIADLILRLRKS